MTGQRRAFSIGFVVPALLYGLTLMIAGKGEFDVNAEPKHRASIILRIAYKKISRDLVIDMETGKEIENYASLTIHERLKKETIFMKVPSPQNFMYFGHMLILMFLGYCGAQFGRWAFWYDSCRRRVAV
ncbi:MAG: hypothetical protein KDB22_28725 [Planctomycetales bacterium]|nr:hypothetical protein [Planctomycetales bacterium]